MIARRDIDDVSRKKTVLLFKLSLFFCVKLRNFVKKIISVIAEFALHFWTEPRLL